MSSRKPVFKDSFKEYFRNLIGDELDGEYLIYIQKNNEVLPWKKFNRNMAIAVEFDLQY